jgi:hypothetical protein
VEHIRPNENVITDTSNRAPGPPTGSPRLVRCTLKGETGEAARESPWTLDRDLDALYGLPVRVKREAIYPRLDRQFTGKIASVPHYLRESTTPHYFVDLDSYSRGFFFSADDLTPLDPSEARRRLGLVF